MRVMPLSIELLALTGGLIGLWFPVMFLFLNFFGGKKVRRSIPAMFVISIFVNIGMWFERYVITVTSPAPGFSSRQLGNF